MESDGLKPLLKGTFRKSYAVYVDTIEHRYGGLFLRLRPPGGNGAFHDRDVLAEARLRAVRRTGIGALPA